MIEIRKDYTLGGKKHDLYVNGVLIPQSQAQVDSVLRGGNEYPQFNHFVTVNDVQLGAKLSKLRLANIPLDVKNLQLSKEVNVPNIAQKISIGRRDERNNFIINLRFSFDASNWKHPWSISQFITQFQRILSEHPVEGAEFRAFPYLTGIDFALLESGLSLPIEDQTDKISDAVTRLLIATQASLAAEVNDDESPVEFDTTQPLVLLIGSIDSEGLRSSLKTADRQYKNKRLDSKPANWNTIASYFDYYEVRCALMKLSGVTYDLLVKPEYEDVREKLLSHLAKVPHVVFVHEVLFSGDYTDEDHDNNLYDIYEFEFRRLNWPRPAEEVRAEVNALLADRMLNVLVYTTNAELTVMASSFIAESEQGLLYRIYVPADRLWANETDRLIQLFRDYLSRTGQRSVRLDQHRIQHGIIYEFFTDPNSHEVENTEQSLAVQFQDFSQFLELSMSEPEQAELLLRSKQIDSREVVQIITRFAKEGKRIQVDMKHEREQKILSIRHRLESELVDELPISTSSETIASLVDAVVPTQLGLTSALAPEQRLSQLSATKGGAITFNFKPQIVNAVNSAVAQEIHGDVHLTQHDQELLRLIQEHATDREAELSLAVHEISDKSVPQPRRLVAKQRLQAFLIQAGKITGDVGVEVLKTYVKSSMGLP